ncbi:hypothetical protein TWF718_005019 [Orbilia javanica]|uniref:Aminoglycoside phosphotransferase domain-containing protein n=1 Tax=Orbilia javanica TaxID=47235 RepID=A0AAN8MW95_9PEZI
MALHETLTDFQVVELCRHRDSGRVVKISDEACVKFGWGVHPEEGENLRIAGEILNSSNIIRVPKFYRYFKKGMSGYLVMEYIEGRQPTESEYNDLVDKIMTVIRQFRDVRTEDNKPGSLAGGISRGYFWNSDYPNFQTTQQLEGWMNRRIHRSLPRVSFEGPGQELVFSHLDLTSRNIIRKDDGTLYLIDWESAGYYPKSFELAALKMVNVNSTQFDRKLQDALAEDLGPEGNLQAECITDAWYKADCYHFTPTEISNRPRPLFNIGPQER